MAKYSKEGESIHALVVELTFTFFKLRSSGDSQYQKYGLSSGRMALMRSLFTGGPQTVSAIAASRPVARQGIQRMVNAMLKDDLLVLTDNPRHKRARLVELSATGSALYQQVLQEEIEFMNRLSEGLSLDSIEQCRALLEQVRDRLEL
ncbi:MAG: MarR family transcriptional regulator [Pseudomonadales bacterium]|nr:MarR family transcriptional regulator [Pseudomonadales bacterium]